MAAFFPLFLNMSNKKVLVYGAGRIAGRRVQALLRYGADITVVAPAIHSEIQYMQKNTRHLKIEQRPYCQGEIQNEYADYVLAATDNKALNAAITDECRQKKILVNNASDSAQCDFYFPALIEQDDLVIAVTSTENDHKKTAATAQALRDFYTHGYILGKGE